MFHQGVVLLPLRVLLELMHSSLRQQQRVLIEGYDGIQFNVDKPMKTDCERSGAGNGGVAAVSAAAVT